MILLIIEMEQQYLLSCSLTSFVGKLFVLFALLLNVDFLVSSLDGLLTSPTRAAYNLLPF